MVFMFDEMIMCLGVIRGNYTPGEYDLGVKSPRGKITSPLKLLYELGVKKWCQGLHCQFGVNI